MLSSGNTDTSNCVVYLENYLDSVENLPDDLQRHLTRMRELDVSYQSFLRDIESLASQYEDCILLRKLEDKNRLLRKVQTILISAQELGDEKLQIVQHLQDLIENRTRSLDNDYRNIDNGSREKETVTPSNSIAVVNTNSVNNNSVAEVSCKEAANVSVTTPSSGNGSSEQRTSKRVRRGRGEADASGGNNEHNFSNQHHHHHHGEHGGSIPMPRMTATLLINNQKKHNAHNNITSTKKKKRKTKQQVQRVSSQKEEDSRSNAKSATNDDDDEEVSIDPDEPTYCLCDQISYGEMICCDNDLCPIEWFHFSCVSLSNKPKGKWFCPKCRGDRPNVMKPKAQFLKELERYNREKEEKARTY